MGARWLHLYAVLLSACTLFLVITGASLTTAREVSPPPGTVFSESAHRLQGEALGVLVVGLAIWLTLAEKRAWLRWLGWTTLALVTAEAFLPTGSTLAALVHASLGQSIFAITVAIALFTSRGWAQGLEPVQDYGWPSMRSLALVTPAMVLVQVTLGAAFRHKATGLMPHVVGAMLVSLTILLMGTFALQQFPQHRSLRPAARTMMAITFAQVFLGIAAFTVRAVDEKRPLVLMSVILGHVAVGGLTLAASGALGILIRRNVHPKVSSE